MQFFPSKYWFLHQNVQVFITETTELQTLAFVHNDIFAVLNVMLCTRERI